MMNRISNELDYIDHPQPGTGLIIIMALFLIGFLVALPAVLLADEALWIRALICILLGSGIAVLVFAFKLVHNTWYQIDHQGLVVKYGSAKTSFPWSEFKDARHKPGLFALKIGWLRVTPCVRLSNAVVLRRQNANFPLYLTPSDPMDFLDRIRQIQPDLQK